MFNPPTLSALMFPEGFVAPGRDRQLYIITAQHIWALYRKSTITHETLGCCASNTKHNTSTCTYIAEHIIKPPTYTQEELPCPKSPPHSQQNLYDTVTIFDTADKPVKRGRGRPRIKCINTKRAGRAPTEYNKFVKRRMEELAKNPEAEDAVMKLDRIAKEWQACKKLQLAVDDSNNTSIAT